MDRLLTHVDPAGDGINREFRLARQVGVIADQIAIQSQCGTAQTADSGLKSGVATGIPAGVEVGKAVEGIGVLRLIAEDMFGTKPDTAAAGKDFVADGLLDRIGVTAGIGLGKGDAHLHRAAGVHRVHVAKQGLAHRQHADHVFENFAHLPLGAKRIDALGIALACRRVDGERGPHHKLGDQQLGRPRVDLLPGDLAKARHHGVGLIGRLLLCHRQHGTDVVIVDCHSLGSERRHHIVGPPLLVDHMAGQKPHDAALHVRRLARLHGWRGRLFGGHCRARCVARCRGRSGVAGTAGQQQGDQQRQRAHGGGNRKERERHRISGTEAGGKPARRRAHT